MSDKSKRMVFIVILIILALGAAIYWYSQTRSDLDFKPPASLTQNYKILGVIDMDNNNVINKEGIFNGQDVYLVVAKNNNYYQKIMDLTAALGNVVTSNTRFELSLVDINQDKIVDTEDPIWKYLYVVVFQNDGKDYQVKPLLDAGIRGIILKHLTPEGNHTVLLSDDTERTLIEFGKPLKYTYVNSPTTLPTP